MGFFSGIRRDYRAVFERDPAAGSAFNVIMFNSGLHSILWYRVAHALKSMDIPVLPAFIMTCVRLISGIEIHPSASIGPGFFIDHGTGVVIGETAEVGEDCLLYQGVTLGGTGKEKGKRHPTLGRGVVVGAGAKVLGAISIGDYAKIGANAVVLKDVPANASVVGVPGRVVRKKVVRMAEAGPVEVLDHIHMPDPVDERFSALEGYVAELEKKLRRLEGKESAMKVYNTMTGRKEDFEPLEPGKAKIYACGITVYDNCHIGHARSAIVFDMIRSYLSYRGFEVTFVKNFTDIDDKIINRANETGSAWDEVARTYTERYYEDMERLGVEKADIEPKATEHIPEIIEIVQGLVDRGHAYEVEGDVYFEVRSFGDYGKLSGRKLDDMEAGARVDVDERKRDPMDFALWKSSKPGEPSWESPWGPGRPGWHIECSAMSRKHLGDSFDIHGGGADLVFPHHENELAQSEAFTGKPFVKYWVHNGFITLAKEKMSKSLGNFFTIADILEKFEPEAVRLFLLMTHYRHPIEFSDEQLREAEAMLDRYYQSVSRATDFLGVPSKKEKGIADELEKAILSMKEKFRESMDDDFNTAGAVGHIYELIRELNRFLDSKPSGEKAREAVRSALDALSELGDVLRLFRRTPEQWYAALLELKVEGVSRADISSMIEKRDAARKEKDYKESDRIRDELASKGVVLEDKPGGVTAWKVRVGN
jgi:cysteinyl-tRNA synthetase